MCVWVLAGTTVASCYQSPSGSGSAAPCGKTSGLQDDFEAGALGAQWVTEVNGASIDGPPAVVDGRAHMAYHATASVADEIVELRSRFAFDLTGSAVSVRPVTVDPQADSTFEIREALGSSYGLKVGMRHRGGRLEAYAWRYDSGGYPEDLLMSAPFDPVEHQRWRVREEAGGLELEVANAMGAYRRFAVVPEPTLDLRKVVVALSMQRFPSQVPGTGAVDFDDVSMDLPPSPACPMEDLADGFTGPAMSWFWERDSDNCTEVLMGGAITLTAGYCAYHSASAYDLTDSVLAVDIASATLGDGSITVTLRQKDDSFLEVRQEGPMLAIRAWRDGEEVGTAMIANPIDGSTAQTWRIEEREGMVELSASVNGEAPRSFFTQTTAALFDLRRLQTRLAVQVGSSGVTSELTLSGVNAP